MCNVTRKAFLKWFALGILAAGILAAAYFAWQRHAAEGTQIAILMYHGVDDDSEDDIWTVPTEEFRLQLASMKANGYTSILPRDIVRVRRGWGFFPKKPVIITFDDGYRNNLLKAEPVLREYGMKAICYPALNYLRDDDASRFQYRFRDILIWPEVREMKKRGTFDIGSHSRRHQGNCDTQARTAASGYEYFFEKAGWKTSDYSYPHGSYSDELIAKLSEKGRYRTAVTCENHVFTYTRPANLYELPRISVYGGVHEFAASLHKNGDGTLEAHVKCKRGTIYGVRGELREKGAGRRWPAEGEPQSAKAKTTLKWTWRDLPADLDAADLELAIVQKDGVFDYAVLPVKIE